MHEIDFKLLNYAMEKRIIKQHLSRKKLTEQVELEPRFNQLG